MYEPIMSLSAEASILPPLCAQENASQCMVGRQGEQRKEEGRKRKERNLKEERKEITERKARLALCIYNLG